MWLFAGMAGHSEKSALKPCGVGLRGGGTGAGCFRWDGGDGYDAMEMMAWGIRSTMRYNEGQQVRVREGLAEVKRIL